MPWGPTPTLPVAARRGGGRAPCFPLPVRKHGEGRGRATALRCVKAFGLLLAALLAAAPSPAAEIAPALTYAPLVERAAPAVVNIFARKVVSDPGIPRAFGDAPLWRLFSDALLFGYGARERIENSLGSGVIVRADGIVVTNHHVIADAEGIFVGLADDRAFPAEVLLSDKRTDIAVLRLAMLGEELPFHALADSDALAVGDIVLAIGNPFGIGQSVSSGIVSALARSGAGIGDFRFFIQTDAAINPGNSGGALVTADGRLVGINTAILTRSGGSQGIGFAVPVNIVRAAIEAAVAGQPLVRPWIGVSVVRTP
ncbi:MAG: trypsin-like peptidase domain-containing protein, partial [Alphaproteobacteria bacterium]|nr:trypsin-like peptidase domain-containing protein [Alphaproteobacteria bacterium]